nr:MAG TPA: cell division protein kinase [Caudoviricetes sp.]
MIIIGISLYLLYSYRESGYKLKPIMRAKNK